MQVTIQPLPPSEGSSVVIDTNPQASVATLLSAYCIQKGMAFHPQLTLLDEKKRPLPHYSTLASLGITQGQNLLISTKEKRFTLTEKWPLLVALAALVIGVIGIITISMIYGLSGGKYPDDYGVVMDAGSSKTNTIVYKWRSNKHKGTGCVSQVENCYAPGGIAEMDPMELYPVINCAKSVTRHIDAVNRPKTPLYFAATAGMRLLNLTDPDRVNQILEQLKLNLPQTELSIKAIEIISGRDEGQYGWITVNFLEQTLERPQKFDPWFPTTYGALDMGGASMQVSYALPEKPDNSSLSVKSLQLYDQTHHIFSHSDLCFGRDEAERRYRYLLLQSADQTDIEDPCLPEGYVFNMSGSNLFSRPCTQSNKFQHTLGKDNYMEKTYYFHGSSNPKDCEGNVSNLLNAELCRKLNFTKCFEKIDNIPRDNQEYLAFATYFFTTNFLNVTKSTLKEYETAVDMYCQKNLTEVNEISMGKYATQYCFNAKYIYEALIRGYGFGETTWKNLKFVSKIAGKDVGWTLGYMIYATNIIPTKTPYPRMITTTALTVSLVLFIIVVIATMVFVLNQNRNRSPYRSKA